MKTKQIAGIAAVITAIGTLLLALKPEESKPIAPSQSVSISGVNNSSIVLGGAGNSATVATSEDNKNPPLPLRQGMPYDEARVLLRSVGWQTEPRVARRTQFQSHAEATTCPNGSDYQAQMCQQFEEWDGCGHVCYMYFRSSSGVRLRVNTNHHEYYQAKTRSGYVDSWYLEPKADGGK